jgi:hypothetical protein
VKLWGTTVRDFVVGQDTKMEQQQETGLCRARYEDGAAARDWTVTFQIYGVLELLMYAT